MDESTIIKIFPKLANDKLFKISSPENPNYNCIAWAYQLFEDRWMQPPAGIQIGLDGITWWPPGIREGKDIQCLVEAFQQKGYVVCKEWEHESGFQKVALYYNSVTNVWTHAARESRNGNHWMSKLGSKNDIEHQSPYTIEGDNYGIVYCIMKKSAV